MKFKDLKAALSRGPLQKIYLLEGEDSWLLSSAEQQIRKKCDLQLEELNDLCFYGDEGPSARIFDALEGIPIGSEYRLVRVRDWTLRAGDFERLTRFDSRPDAGTVLIIANRKRNPDYASKFPCVAVDCRRESEDVVEYWTAALAGSFGAPMSRPASDLLCAYCLYDMGRITSELRKLASYAGGREITADDIRSQVAKETEYQVFELTDSILKRNGNAAEILEELLRQNDPSPVLGALFANFSRMYAVKTSGLPQGELAKALKVKEYAVKMLLRNGAKFSAEDARRAMEIINEGEFSFKSGRVAPDVAVRQIVLRLLSL